MLVLGLIALFFPIWQRRALRTASEKLKSRTSFSATAVQHSPATRVNRYIGRLIEARQTESRTSDLNQFTLFYRSRDREHRVRPCTHLLGNICFTFTAEHTLIHQIWTFSQYTWGKLLRDCKISLPLSHSHTIRPTQLITCLSACERVCLYEESTHPLRGGCR